MNLPYIIFIAIGLAMDAFAVAIGASAVVGRITRRFIFRLAFHFGLFQAVMPIIGWFAGRPILSSASAWDHWIAFSLLAFIGLKAIYTALRDRDKKNKQSDPSRGTSLILLSLATSIDALAVGVSLAALEIIIWFPAAIIGLITAGLTIVGIVLGNRLGSHFGRKMEFVGGVILILIGIKILLAHML
jgi:putative Mn2+ efflux pump MntP